MKMKKKFWGIWILLLVMAVIVTAGGCGGSSSSEKSDDEPGDESSITTLSAGTYEELYNHLKSVNPDGSRYDATKDDVVVIELTADLDAEAVGTEADYVTGATLTIARGNITIDGKGKKIESHGLPSFYVRANDPAKPLSGWCGQ
jgi:hypothetical protein